MRILAPSAWLAPFVREVMVVETTEAVTRVRLPEPGLVLGVRYRGSARLLDGAAARLPDLTLTGMTAVARRMHTAAASGVILVRFRPAGAARFFAQPLHELFGTTASLVDLLPRRDAARLQAQVVEAANDRARAAVLESFLAARLRPEEPDPIVGAAVDAITGAGGVLPISVLARRLAISRDPLEKRFRRAVGTSPKQFASLVRLHRAIDGYRPGASLTQLALEAGYFDQAHFSRALRAVTGQPPGQFLRTGAHR
ncbi:MAG TPA: helix-turn-helix domain-containing protein [Polyangia bacterium]|nr:helix-turn-helix domain-containing protein [Polyangia bacterium]